MEFYIIAQVIGILGMVMNSVSYQVKKQKNIIIIQFFGSLFFAINMFMIKAYIGAFLNSVGILRAFIYANKKKIQNIKIVNIIFILIYCLSYVLTYVLFDKPITVFNLAVELLPVIAMVSTTISFVSLGSFTNERTPSRPPKLLSKFASSVFTVRKLTRK